MMVRTPSYDKNGLKKGTWTPEEDRKLVDYITRYGHWNWRLLPKFAGLARCGKSCRLRWLNYLRPNLKRGNYTEEEEDTIIKLHRHLGNRWSTIAARMPGRTDNEIKNHWHSNLKKKSQQDSSKEAHEISNTEDQSPTEPTESPTFTSTNENHFLKDEFAFWDADTDLVTGNLWSEAYVLDTDISYVPCEPENFSSVFDAELWSHDQ